MSQINLKEKTVDELKVLAWDLRTTLDNYSQAYNAVVGELATRQVPAQTEATETTTI